MKNVLLYIFLIIGNFAIAQQDKEPVHSTGLSDADLATAKALFIKMVDSDLYINNFKLNRQFFSMLPKNFESGSLETDAGFRTAIAKRITDSKFKSVEDAANWRKRMLDSETAVETNNPEVFRLMRRASTEQLREIFKPEDDRMRQNAGFR